MNFPMSFPKSEYTQQRAIDRYNALFFGGTFTALRSVGLTLEPIGTIYVENSDDFHTISLWQSEKYDMTPEARELFNKFVEQIGKDFNKMPAEERGAY